MTPEEVELDEYSRTLPDNIQKRIREAIARDEDSGNITLLHDLEGGMVGTTTVSGVVTAVYERENSIKALAKIYETDSAEEYKNDPERDAYTDAVEWYEYNTLRTLPYIKTGRPFEYTGFLDPLHKEGLLEEEYLVKVKRYPADTPKSDIDKVCTETSLRFSELSGIPDEIVCGFYENDSGKFTLCSGSDELSCEMDYCPVVEKAKLNAWLQSEAIRRHPGATEAETQKFADDFLASIGEYVVIIEAFSDTMDLIYPNWDEA